MYELYVFDAKSSPNEAAARDQYEHAPYYATSRPIRERNARKWNTVRTLVRGDDSREVWAYEDKDFAQDDNRHVQVAEGDCDHIIRWDVFDTAVEISVSPPPQGDTADAVIKRLFESLRRLRFEGYTSAFDPQLGRVLNIDTDAAEVLAAYGRAIAAAHEPTQAAPAPSPAPTKPWWKFW